MKIQRSINIIGYDKDVNKTLWEKCLKRYVDEVGGKVSKTLYDIIPIVVSLSESNNINPAFVYTQICKETGWMYKNGSRAGLDESFCNPCGLKVTKGGGDFTASAHKRFSSWSEGIQAQIDHALLYAGAPGYPKENTPDPRHFKFILGTAKTVKDLTGKWATPKPGADYGQDLINMMNKIYDYIDEDLANVIEQKEEVKPAEPAKPIEKDFDNSKPHLVITYSNKDEMKLASAISHNLNEPCSILAEFMSIDKELKDKYKVVKVKDILNFIIK